MDALAVFLVEDNSHIRLSLIPALQDLIGAQILATAESESDAVAWLAAHKGEWDLAVIELFLKRGTGLGVVGWTHGRLQRQKVVVLADHASDTVRRRCRNAGADAVFDKETELDQFIAFCLGLNNASAGRQG
ncbi:MAG: response regulator [Proteobacteria bacterium]|nr:response regulator [Pseudomonadota bacterium]